MTPPSSRAAFLFRSSGQPVARRDFEATLEKTDALLGERGGPFFAGESPTAPDVCWAPFLERYAAQLPLLHDGLRPRDATRYPRHEPKVWSHRRAGTNSIHTGLRYLRMAVGCGATPHHGRKCSARRGSATAGACPRRIPTTGRRRATRGASRVALRRAAYAADRPWVAPSPDEEAAATILRRRDAIRDGAARRGVLSGRRRRHRGRSARRRRGSQRRGTRPSLDEDAATMARDLDDRLCGICCPRRRRSARPRRRRSGGCMQGRLPADLPALRLASGAARHERAIAAHSLSGALSNETPQAIHARV